MYHSAIAKRGVTSLLCLKHIKKNFGSASVLKDVNLTVKGGDVICIAGKNAAGKTTLLNIAAGIQKADSGEVIFDKKPSLLTQEPAVLPRLSVEDNLRLWYAAADIPWRGFDMELCEFMPQLFEQRKKRAEKLSGGMKKRLSIACSLAVRADILLFDEPFAALDPEGCLLLTGLISRLKAENKAICFTSHEPQHIADTADELFLLKNGFLEQAATLNNIFAEKRRQAVLSALFGDNTGGTNDE